MGSKPPAAVVVRISKDGRDDLGGIAALDDDVIPSRESRRFGHHAEIGRVGHRAGINPASRKAIPMHRLYCCSDALRALANLCVCGPVCLHGKTWLPSVMLRACQTLIYTSPLSKKLIHVRVPLFESLFRHSIYILHRGLARPKFFLPGDGAIALGDSLALLP